MSTLHELTRGKTEFTWKEHYGQAFREAKYHVANAVMLKYFDPDGSITIECDASGVGVGRALLQNGQPVTLFQEL